MSYYTVINNTLNEELYINSLRKKKVSDIYHIPITNWTFFIPIAYLLVLFIWGIIYSANKDSTDFKIMNSYDEAMSNQSPTDNAVTFNAIIFYRKMMFQQSMKRSGFCQLYKLFLMMLHPLARLKYRFDMNLPRVYHFLTLFTRFMIILGLCFYFLRNYTLKQLLKA